MRFRSTILVLAAACWMQQAWAVERPEDATLADALGRHARAVATLERDFFAVIANAPSDERFDLYRTYDALIASWVQVDRLQSLLDSVAVAPAADEAEIRTALAEHAQFTLWELDEADAELARDERSATPRVSGDVRGLLMLVRETVARYWLAVMPPST